MRHRTAGQAFSHGNGRPLSRMGSHTQPIHKAIHDGKAQTGPFLAPVVNSGSIACFTFSMPQPLSRIFTCSSPFSNSFAVMYTVPKGVTVSMNNAIGHRLRHRRFNIAQFINGWVQLRGKGCHRRTPKGLIGRTAKKRDRHFIDDFFFCLIFLPHPLPSCIDSGFLPWIRFFPASPAC